MGVNNKLLRLVLCMLINSTQLISIKLSHAENYGAEDSHSVSKFDGSLLKKKTIEIHYDKGSSLLAEAFDYKDYSSDIEYKNKINEAMIEFSKILAIDKNSILGLKGFASAYLLLSDYNRAIKEYKAILAVEHDNFEALFNLGIVYKQVNNLKKARVYFRKAKRTADMNKKIAALYTSEYNKILEELRNIDSQ